MYSLFPLYTYVILAIHFPVVQPFVWYSLPLPYHLWMLCQTSSWHPLGIFLLLLVLKRRLQMGSKKIGTNDALAKVVMFSPAL